MSKTHLLLLIGACLGISLLIATGSFAATTVGPAEPNPNPAGAVHGSFPSGDLLFNKTAPAGETLATPSAGTITSWRLYTDEVGPEATAQLYALTPAGTENYVVVAIGPKESLPAVDPGPSEENDILRTFSADLTVPAGAMLGVRLEYPPTSTIHPVYYLSGTWTTGLVISPPSEGGTATAVSYAQQMAMNATFEPAGGGSGSGATTPTCVGACGASTSPAAPQTVAPSPTPRCVVPKLQRKKLKAAEKAIRKADCKVGKVTKKKGVSTATGKVVKQKPKAGTVGSAGAKVSVKLG